MEHDLTTPALGEATIDASETQSAVSWGAVFAGAVTALALSFVLVALAAGFGLKLAAPWPGVPVDLAGFTPTLGAFMIAVQVLSGALGGYLAGRLRTKWTNVHGHEVHFRDTAHGLLAWAASTLMGLILAASLLAPLTTPMTDAAMSAAAVQADAAPPSSADLPPAAPLDRAAQAALQARAERDAGIAAQFSLFMGIGLLLGAFTACVAAAIGGLRREEMHTQFWTEHARARRPVGP